MNPNYKLLIILTKHPVLPQNGIFLFMKYLIVGLGNPGPKYELTRHNIGFLTLDRLAEQQEASFEVSRLAEVASVKHKGRTLHLVKPTTFMNLSGKAVNYWLQELKVPKKNLLSTPMKLFRYFPG